MIDIGTVLRHFDDTVDEEDLSVKNYGIRFITADGRLRTMQCRKNVKEPKRGLRKDLSEKGRVMFNLKRNGTMLVQDLEIDQPRAVKVASITQFKNHNSTEWSNIYH